MDNGEIEEPTEDEFEEIMKDIFKPSNKPMKDCSGYPTKEQLSEKFKLERKP